jgi:hypothetical protein
MMRLDFLDKARSLFQNKKFLIIAGSVLAAVVVVFVGFRFFVKGYKGVKESAKKEARTGAKKEKKSKAVKEVKKEENKIVPAAVPGTPNDSLSPHKIIEAETALPQAPSVQEMSKAVVQSAPVKRPASQRYVRKRIKDTSVLLTMLDTGIEKGNEALIGQAITGLNLKGDSAVSILREKILENFSRPQIRKYAVLGLFYCGTSDTIPVLKTVIKVDPDEDVRISALYALDNINPDDIAEFLEVVAREDTGERVRKAAKEYIEFRSIDQ